jgi:hypothetical protein
VLASGYAEVTSAVPADVPLLAKPFDQDALAYALSQALAATKPAD